MAKGKWEYPRAETVVQPPSEERDGGDEGRAIKALWRAHTACEIVARGSLHISVSATFSTAAETLAEVISAVEEIQADAEELAEDD